MLSESVSIRLATQLDALPLILEGADSQALRRRPAPGEWSAHENLAHLARVHEVFIERLRRILTEERPILGRYRAEEDPEWARWSGVPPEEVLGRLKRLRSQLTEMVKRLMPEQVSRVGVHPLFGDMTIPAWIEFFLLHEAHHLYTAMLRARGS
ncbi:MAG: DinB family protein [Candidatus Rokubacteria bacterium]|nr:DinB family protein [Candidatus Rokubacteria bacterium]